MSGGRDELSGCGAGVHAQWSAAPASAATLIKVPVRPTLPRHCPACGGPNKAHGAGACQFCTAPLVPLGTPDPRSAVPCSCCATLNAGGASFCSSCGYALARHPGEGATRNCPGCADRNPNAKMYAWGLAPTAQRPQGHPVFACKTCGGVWVDAETLQAVLASAQSQPMGRGVGERGVERRKMAAGTFTAKIVYRRCAQCGERMNRRNFARVSGIIVDECGAHGTFFDAGELEAILEFVQTGGLELSHRRGREEHERSLRAQRAASQHHVRHQRVHVGTGIGLGAAFGSWLGGWLSDF